MEASGRDVYHLSTAGCQIVQFSFAYFPRCHSKCKTPTFTAAFPPCRLSSWSNSWLKLTNTALTAQPLRTASRCISSSGWYRMKDWKRCGSSLQETGSKGRQRCIDSHCGSLSAGLSSSISRYENTDRTVTKKCFTNTFLNSRKVIFMCIIGILLMYYFGETLSPSDTHLHPFKWRNNRCDVTSGSFTNSVW